MIRSHKVFSQSRCSSSCRCFADDIVSISHVNIFLTSSSMRRENYFGVLQKDIAWKNPRKVQKRRVQQNMAKQKETTAATVYTEYSRFDSIARI